MAQMVVVVGRVALTHDYSHDPMLFIEKMVFNRSSWHSMNSVLSEEQSFLAISIAPLQYFFKKKKRRTEHKHLLLQE